MGKTEGIELATQEDKALLAELRGYYRNLEDDYALAAIVRHRMGTASSVQVEDERALETTIGNAVVGYLWPDEADDGLQPSPQGVRAAVKQALRSRLAEQDGST